MPTSEQMMRAFYENIEAATGKSITEWVELVLASPATTHRTMRELLQNQHGMGYGYANAVANQSIAKRDGVITSDELIEAQYAGKKAALRPLYESMIEQIDGFGDDVEVAPKKGYVSLRRSKQFGLIQPAAGRLDIGIVLKGTEPDGRLEAAGSWNGMVSHRYRVNSEGDVAGAIEWLRKAYNNA